AIETVHGPETRSLIIRLKGAATARDTKMAAALMQEKLERRYETVTIDLAQTCLIDARFLGLLLMLRKHLNRLGTRLAFVGLSRAMRRTFRLNELQFLLD